MLLLIAADPGAAMGAGTAAAQGCVDVTEELVVLLDESDPRHVWWLDPPKGEGGPDSIPITPPSLLSLLLPLLALGV